MSYQVFARKYRPKTFDDVLGQEHVVRTLRNAIAQKRLAHAYLFVGPRGTGKTSTARIFAKALNCSEGPRVDFDPEEDICREIAEGRSLDVLEIDGASNNSVDQIRDLRDMASFAPARGQFRIFYIDEVHMLSSSAFNALLKILEEPPGHVKFIFATTEAHKVLPTIISRCQRFDLRRIPDQTIADHLLHIAEKEGVRLDPLAALSIAKGADGGMRDAQSMLDQLVAFCGAAIKEEDVLHIFGFTAHETISTLTTGLLEKNTAKVLETLHSQADAGKDLSKLLADVISHFRNLLIYKVDASSLKEMAPAVLETLEVQAPLVTTERLLGLIDQFAEVDGRMKWAPNKRLYIEVGCIKAVRSLEEVSLSDVIATLGGAMGLAANAPGPVEAVSAEKKTANLEAVATVISAKAEESAVAAVEVPSAEVEPTPPTPSIEAPHFAGTTEPAQPRLLGFELWAATVDILKQRKPMQAGFAQEASFLEQSPTSVLIGFSPQSQMARDALNRPAAKTAVEEILSELAGCSLSLRIDVRDDIAPPPTPEFPTTEELLAVQAAASAAKAATAAEKEGKTPSGATVAKSNELAAPPPPEDPPMDEETRKKLEEEFYSDPAIKLALEIFDGQIIAIQAAK